MSSPNSGPPPYHFPSMWVHTHVCEYGSPCLNLNASLWLCFDSSIRSSGCSLSICKSCEVSDRPACPSPPPIFEPVGTFTYSLCVHFVPLLSKRPVIGARHLHRFLSPSTKTTHVDSDAAGTPNKAQRWTRENRTALPTGSWRVVYER